jgi:hypothetical protein
MLMTVSNQVFLIRNSRSNKKDFSQHNNGIHWELIDERVFKAETTPESHRGRSQVEISADCFSNRLLPLTQYRTSN